eukprot:1041699-Amphidinium_carterae.1
MKNWGVLITSLRGSSRVHASTTFNKTQSLGARPILYQRKLRRACRLPAFGLVTAIVVSRAAASMEGSAMPAFPLSRYN